VKHTTILLLAAAAPVVACDYPDEGNMPLRRAVSRVKYLPQTETWAAEMHKAGAHVQYALLLDRPAVRNGRCYWTLEVKANGELWRSFLVSPEGRVFNDETAGRPAS
jgi:hypothetical protein